MTTIEPYRRQRLGNLNRRVWLQRHVETRNDFNEIVFAWQNEARIWARIEPLKGVERFEAGGIQDTAHALIHIRFRDDVNPAAFRIIEGETEHDGNEDKPASGAVVWNITGTRQLDERRAYLAMDVAGATA